MFIYSIYGTNNILQVNDFNVCKNILMDKTAVMLNFFHRETEAAKLREKVQHMQVKGFPQKIYVSFFFKV